MSKAAIRVARALRHPLSALGRQAHGVQQRRLAARQGIAVDNVLLRQAELGQEGHVARLSSQRFEEGVTKLNG